MARTPKSVTPKQPAKATKPAPKKRATGKAKAEEVLSPLKADSAAKSGKAAPKGKAKAGQQQADKPLKIEAKRPTAGKKTASAGAFDPMAVSKTKTARRGKQTDLPPPEPPEEPKRVKYERRFAELARRMFMAKVPDDEIADFFGIDIEELEWWKEEHPDFADAFRRDQRNYGGRPSEWDDRYLAIAATLAELGATDLEISQAFDVTIRTIYRWKLERPEFRAALELGKEVADRKVEDSLYKRATGYSFDSEKIVVIEGEAQRVEIIEHVPPDTKAAMWWLQNRRPGVWRDVRHIKHDIPPDGELAGWLNGLSGRSFAPKELTDASPVPAQPEPVAEKPRQKARSIVPADDEDDDA